MGAETSKKRIGIVGLGKIGLFHLSIIRNLKNAEIVGLMDPVKSVQKMVEGMGIQTPFHASVEELINHAKPDGIFACVPPAFNLSIAEACASKGVSLFLEKPLSSSLKDANKILGLLSRQGETIVHEKKPSNAVGYMVAYFPIFEHARKLLNEKCLGEVRHYIASVSLGEVFKKQEGWRQNPAISGGGSVAVVGSHLLYLIQSFFGMPERLRAHAIRFFSEVEDSCHAGFEHQGNLIGQFHVSWSRPGYPEMGYQIQVEGTEGFMEITESSLALYRFKTNSWETFYPWDFPSSKNQLDSGQQGYVSQDSDFIDCIGAGRSPRVTWEDGLKVQKIIEAIYRSSKSSGNIVELSAL